MGVVMSRWASQSSKLVAGRAERAAVGSTPILSRQINCQLTIDVFQMSWLHGG